MHSQYATQIAAEDSYCLHAKWDLKKKILKISDFNLKDETAQIWCS